MKRKVHDIKEIVSNRGNCYKLVTYKLDAVYYLDIHRQNTITGNFEHYKQCHFEKTKEDLFKLVDKAEHYLTNKDIF